MKNFNVLTTLLFCIFFVNISIAQTVKKQQINKELLTNKTKTDSNIKSADVLSDEKKSVSLIQKKTQKSKKIDFNIESSKVKMISPSNVVPNTTITQNSSPPPPRSSSCGLDSTEIVITIVTDNNPTQISWFLMDQFGLGWTNTPLTVNDANSTLTWTLCVPDSNCYTFTMLDDYGDGIINGSYTIAYGGVVVASGGANFADVQEHCNIGYCPNNNCIIAIPANAIPEGEPCGIDANHGCDDNWKISNFTITGVTDIWSFGGFAPFPNPFGSGCVHPGDDPDLYVYMRKNSSYFYYSGYYPNTWYPNNGFSCSSQPLSFSMYPNNITSPLEVPTRGLFTSPYLAGQTFNYEFLVGDDDQGSFLNIFGGNDYIGSYTLPAFTTSSTFSITTSGGPDGNAYVDYTTIAPSPIYTPLTNNNVIHGTFWAENNIRDSDWYDFTVNDTSYFTINAIAEAPFNIMLMDASGDCRNPIIIDDVFAYACDTLSIQETLAPGSYWLLVVPTAYSCMDCDDSTDYLLDVNWVVECNLTDSISVIPANCVSPNGSINLTVNGGELPYTYLWSNGDTSQNLNNVPVGTYNVIINAANNNCDTTLAIYVPDYSNQISLTYTMIPESAIGSFDGSIDISVAGGVPPFIYNWSGPNSFSDTAEDISTLESGMYYITIIDSNGCVTSDSIEVLEYSIDVGVSAFISPSSSCSLDSTEQIIVQITNYNTLDATNFLVSYQYNGQTFTDSVTSVVPAGGSVIYTFNSTINTYLPGTYYLSSFTSNVLDLDYSNDTSATNFTNYYHDFYSSDYEMGFEPNQDFSGWVIEDANNDSCTWTLHPLSGFNQSYGIFYNWNTNGITAADDWLISQCFEFEANQTYSLEFKYRAAAAFFPEDMTVNIGSIQQGSSLSTVLLQMNNIINIVYDSTEITFSVPSTGTYYIGWHAVSNSSMWRIDLDDINISVILPDVYGCIDSTALNYDSLANVDDSSCVYCIYGCMDSTSFNYDSTATCPSLCIPIIYGCMDSTAINYYTAANIDNGSCIYILFGCTDSLATNYNSLALYDDGSCIYPPGCMDSTAINYNPNAIISDSSCIYPPGCMDSTAINYNPNATVSDSTCVYPVYGCIDTAAVNYNLSANTDDGSCTYCTNDTSYTNITACDSIVWNGTTYDSSGTYSYSGSAVNNNYSMSFDGNDDYIDLGNSNDFDFSNSPLSIMCWVYMNNSSWVDGIISKNLSSNLGWWLASLSNDPALSHPNTFSFGGAASSGNYFAVYSPIILNDWVFLSSTHINGEQKLYVNGLLIDQSSHQYDLYNSATNLLIGKKIGDTYFDGLIDNISIWQTLLSQSEIQNYMNCPPTGNEAGLVGYWDFEEGSGNTVYDQTSNGNNGTINGATYNTNVPSQSCNLTNTNGCDSTVILVLTINNCAVFGCTDSTSLNFNPLANTDDGSCMYSCGPITGVNLTDVIHDRATFNWDNMNLQNCQVDQIRFRYREVGTNSYSTKTMGVPVGSGCNTSNTSKLVLGLTPSTTYEYNFKIWYCNASTVNWHANGQFTTSPPCDNVTNVTVQPLNPSKVRVCWDSVSTYAFVRLKYRKDTAASTYYNIGGSGVYSPNLCKDKNGLAPNTNYKLIYRTWCSPSGGPYRSPQWDGPVFFSTPSVIRSDELSTISSLDVYPNPSRDVFNVEFTSESKQSIEVRVVNLVGEIIFTENLKDFEGEYSHSFNLSEYSKGIYLLELDTDNGIVNKKLILQ